MKGYQVELGGQTFKLLGNKLNIKKQLKGMFSPEEIESAKWTSLSQTEVSNLWKPKPLTKEQMVENLLKTGKHTQESAQAAIEYLYGYQESEHVQHIKTLIAKDAGIV